MFKKLPFILLGIIACVMAFGSMIPLSIKSLLYGLSASIKSLIVFALPMIVFGLIFRAALTMAKNATWVIGLLVGGVAGSTFLALLMAHMVGLGLASADINMELAQAASTLPIGMHLNIPSIMRTDVAMASAIVLGLLGAFFAPRPAEKLAAVLDVCVGYLLRAITYGIPFFVTGFIVKLQHEGTIGLLVEKYALIFAVMSAAQIGYTLFLYWATAGFSFSGFIRNLGPMIPAAISGFSTMSSAASLPPLIQGVQATTRYPFMARITAPLLVNIHMIGECFTIVILAYAILKSYGIPLPGWDKLFPFAGFFFLARFSVAAVPGGGIWAVVELLKDYFGFTSEMITLMTTLYILFDPILTTTNVLGDGVLAQALDRALHHLPRLRSSLAPAPGAEVRSRF
jgi:Na+/H+-dicarboxylate symporter